jgi:hypothetical protein
MKTGKVYESGQEESGYPIDGRKNSSSGKLRPRARNDRGGASRAVYPAIAIVGSPLASSRFAENFRDHPGRFKHPANVPGLRVGKIPMKVLIDLTVFLDVIQKNSAFYENSSAVLSKVLMREIDGVLTGSALSAIFYAVSKFSDSQRAYDMIDWFLANFEISPLDKSVFINSRNSEIGDFEDAVTAFSADFSQCDCIVSRNLSGFTKSPVPVLTPEELLNRIKKD